MNTNNEKFYDNCFTEIEEGKVNTNFNKTTMKCFDSEDNKFSMDCEGNLVVNSIITREQSSSTGVTFDQIYPVGSIYMSVNATNPSVLFGGTWEKIDDKFLYCTTNGKQTGGSQKLDISSLIHYAHGSFGLQDNSGSYADRQITGIFGKNGIDEQNYHPFSNIELPLPPYFTICAWHRIS